MLTLFTPRHHGITPPSTQAPKVRSTPWGASYRAPPTILHGYDKVVSGSNAQERLDLRCAAKADKFCK